MQVFGAVGGDAAFEVFSIIAIITAVVLQVSPMRSFWRIAFHSHNSETESPYIYVAMLLNCVAALIYGIQKHELAVKAVNGFGICLQAVYLITFFVYAKAGPRWEAACSFIGGCIVYALVLVFLHSTTEESYEMAVLTGGMYLAQLSTVLCNKPVQVALAWFTLGNAIAWTCYGGLAHPPDCFLMIPNAIGIVVAATLLVVKCFMPPPPATETAPVTLQTTTTAINEPLT